MSSEREGVARARYSFSRDGSLIKVETAPDSAAHTATIALKAEGAGDLQAAKKVEEAPWSAAGAKRGAVTGATAPVLTTARRSLIATIAPPRR